MVENPQHKLQYQSVEAGKYERKGLLRQLFGPSKQELWHLLSQELGGTFEAGTFWSGRDCVRVAVGEWEITLDTYVVSTGESSTTYTRLRAPYVNADGTRFAVYRASFLSPLGAWFGLQDIQVGDAEFDQKMVVKGNNEARVRLLLSDPELRRRILAQPRVHFEVQDDEGWFGKRFPEGVDALKYVEHGVITDLQRLRELFDLFAYTLHRLCHIGSAYEDDPGLRL